MLLKDELVSLPPGSRDQPVTAEVYNGRRTRARSISRCQDNGPGLPQEALRLVFDPFVLRSDTPVEYGINLMTCYFIVHHHGGKIQAHSEPGQGTHFVINLPLNPAGQWSPRKTRTSSRRLCSHDNLWQKLITAG